MTRGTDQRDEGGRELRRRSHLKYCPLSRNRGTSFERSRRVKYSSLRFKKPPTVYGGGDHGREKGARERGGGRVGETGPPR